MEGDILTLTDDARDPRDRPTRENIIRAMQWLVSGAQPNDSLFFHCEPAPIQYVQSSSDTNQILDMVGKQRILMVMRPTGMTKVSMNKDRKRVLRS